MLPYLSLFDCHVFQLIYSNTVNDPDGDRIRCRWAKSSPNECAGVCLVFPGAVLDEVSN